jgi:putative DNA primase/helicase
MPKIVKQLTKSAEHKPGLSNSENNTDSPFVVIEQHILGGIFVKTNEGRNQYMCPYIKNLGVIVDPDGKNIAYRLVLLNSLGHKVFGEISAEDMTTNARLLKCLLNLGLEIRLDMPTNQVKAIAMYLEQERPIDPPEIRAKQDGWIRGGDNHLAYVLNGNSYGAPASKHLFVPASKKLTKNSEVANKDSWLELMKSLEQDKLAVLGICAGFAAPLLALLNHPTTLLFFAGTSSTGKTSLLKLIASMFGGLDRMATWNGTDNGLLAQAQANTDRPMVIDEVGQSKGRQFAQLAYDITNGTGKLRALSDGSAAQSVAIRTLLVSAGEVSPLVHMQKAGIDIRQGQVARLVSVPVAQPYGIWSSINGYGSGAEKSQEISKIAKDFNGLVSQRYCKYLANKQVELLERYQAEKDNLAVAIKGDIEWDTSNGVCERVLQNFVIFALAGIVAIEAETVPWTHDKVVSCVSQCFGLWHADYLRMQPTKQADVLNSVRLFFQSERGLKFKPFKDWNNDHSGTTAGFEYIGRKTGARSFLVLPAYFESVLCKEHGLATTLDALRESNLLVEGPRGVPTKQMHLPNSGEKNRSFYVIRDSIIHC